jgi:hypothetical protein
MTQKLTPEELEKLIHRELRSLPPKKARPGFEARLEAAVAARTGLRSASAKKLEQAMHRELRALPLRKAPATLEARVMAALEAQAAVAWYHKSWSYWPAAVRGAFLAIATAIAGVVIFAAYRALTTVGEVASAKVQTVSSEVEQRFAIVTKLYQGVMWTVDLAHTMIAGIPSLWLYGGLAVAAVAYVTFFGIGAVAYRTLYRSSN